MTASPVLAAAAVALLALAAIALGRTLAVAAAGPAAARGGGAWGMAADGLGGLAVIHLMMLGLDAAGVPWTAPALLGAFLLPPAAALAARAVRRRRLAVAGADAPPVPLRLACRPAVARPRPGDLAALAIVGLYAALAWTRWIAIPDFVYHWGVKGVRFHLARGIDWAFLSDPLRLAQHPDYPNLLPDLYAAAAALAGGFDERAQMLWSALFLAALPAAAHETWRRLGTAPAARGIGVVAVTAAAAMFGIGYRLAGGGELAIAAALAVALPVLAAPSREPGEGAADALRLGFAAAFAAGAKLEGLALAAILIGLWLLRALVDRAGGPRARLSREGFARLLGPLAAAAALPAALVVAPWLAAVHRHGLLSPSHPGALDPARAAVVLRAVAEAFGTREWHGFGWLLAALVPALLFARRSRWIGLACALQLGFYLWVYLASPLEPRFYVLSSLPRLLFHLVPSALIGAVALLGYPASGKRPVSA